MKISYFICFFVLWFQTVNCQNIQKLKFTLNISHTEKSKDSHSKNEIWKLEGDDLSFYQSFSGRLSAKKPVRKTQKLSAAQITAIEKLLMENDLYKNIPSPKYSEFMIPYSAISAHLSISKDKENYSIQLYGLAREMPKNMDYQGMMTLVVFLNEAIGD